MDLRTHTLETRLGPLHVEERGAGPAVVCWPSLYCDARTLDPVTTELARTHRVVVIDGPGHGGSGVTVPRFTLEDCADAARAVMDQLGVDRATWLGVAWGGHVGVAVARAHPARVERLFLVNAPMNAWDGPKHFLMTRLAYALLVLFGHRGFMCGVICNNLIARSARDRAALLEVVMTAMRRCERRGFLTAVRSAMLGRPDLVPVLGELQVPTTFVAGAEDPLLPVEVARRQAAAIPGCTFVVIEGSSHQSPLEAPARMLGLLRSP